MRPILALLFTLLAATAMAQGPQTAPQQMPRIEPLGPLSGPPSVPGAVPTPGTDPSAPPSVPPPEATAPDLVVDLSLARVSITSAFQGESILLFGTFDPPGDIVVVVQGPPAREQVMRKERVLGVWLNTGRQSFDNVPAYYAIAASQPLARLMARGASGEVISLEDRLVMLRAVGVRAPEDLARFRNGLVEVKRRDGLYPAANGQVQVQANRLFRAELPFPSKLPEGVYEVRVYLLREGKIVAAVSRPLPVGKVGFSAKLAGWADEDGAFYGLAAIAMALFAGWFGGAVVRRISLN